MEHEMKFLQQQVGVHRDVTARQLVHGISAMLLLLLSRGVSADGIVIDKVYHPYVDALEQEVELRSLLQDEQQGLVTPAQLHQLSLGTALSDAVFAELYLIGAKTRNGEFETEAWELEVKWQLSEQGEYWADYGLLFEYEDEIDADISEVTVGFLAEKELGDWSAAANLFLIREWGRDIQAEYETALAMQLRYRLRPEFEPAIEVYAGEDTRGIGPVLQGTLRTGVRRSLHWEAGLIFGVGASSPDQTWRLLFEYEF
jgi:hypothetical protein